MNHKKIFIQSLLLLLLGNLMAASDTLKIAEVFNWRPGDTLIYQTFTCNTIPTGPSTESYTCFYGADYGFSVETKQLTGDTITYVVRLMNGQLDTLVVSDIANTVDMLSYSSLMPFYGGCEELRQMPASDSLWRPLINSNGDFTYPFRNTRVSYVSLEIGYDAYYGEGVGLTYAMYSAKEYWPSNKSGGCGIKLVFYKSDSLVWFDADHYIYDGIDRPGLSSNEISIYPNPVKSSLFIRLPDGYTGIKELRVYDVLGRLLSTETGTEGSLQKELNVSALLTGMYVLEIEGFGGEVSRRLKFQKE